MHVIRNMDVSYFNKTSLIILYPIKSIISVPEIFHVDDGEMIVVSKSFGQPDECDQVSLT